MNEEPKGKSAVAGILWIATASVVGYVLSIGPVGALVLGSPRGVEWVEKIYAPVVWLHDHTILKKPLEMYSKLWGW